MPLKNQRKEDQGLHPFGNLKTSEKEENTKRRPALMKERAWNSKEARRRISGKNPKVSTEVGTQTLNNLIYKLPVLTLFERFLRGRSLKGRCNIRVYVRVCVCVCVCVCPSALPLIGSAQTDPVQFKWGFGGGLLKDKFAFFEASKSPIPKRRKLLAKRPFL